MADIIMNTESKKQLPRRWSLEQRAKLSQIMKEKHAAKAAAGKPWKPKGRRLMTKEMASRIRELRKTGGSVESIAEQLNVSESSVYKFSKEKPYRRPGKRGVRQMPKLNGRDTIHGTIFDGMSKEDAWLHVTLWHDEYVKTQMNKIKREIPGADQVLLALGLLPRGMK